MVKTLTRDYLGERVQQLCQHFNIPLPPDSVLTSVFNGVSRIYPARLDRIVDEICRTEKALPKRTNFEELILRHHKSLGKSKRTQDQECDKCGGSGEILVHVLDGDKLRLTPFKCGCGIKSAGGMMFFDKAAFGWRDNGVKLHRGIAYIEDRIVLVDIKNSAIRSSPDTGRAYIDWRCEDCGEPITYWAAIRWVYHCGTCFYHNHTQKKAHPHNLKKVRLKYMKLARDTSGPKPDSLIPQAEEKDENIPF